MVEDTNLTLAKRLTFSDAMRMSWLPLSSAFRIAVAFWAAWLFGGQTVSSTAIVQKNASGDIESVKRLEIVYQNLTVTWVKRSVT